MKELELVTDFNSLKSGDVVYDLLCNCCGKSFCKAILDKLEPEDEDFYGGWTVSNPCVPKMDCNPIIDEHMVRNNRVFKLIDKPVKEKKVLETLKINK